MELLRSALSAIDNFKRVMAARGRDAAANPAAYLEQTLDEGVKTTIKLLEDPMNFIGRGVGGAIKPLYHGGRRFSVWNPKTVGFGEPGQLLAQGPGLYAGDKTELAKLYLKYGGEDPALLRLLVDDDMIINPALKMSSKHKEAYMAAESLLDSLGLRASHRGLRNSIIGNSDQEVRQALVDSGVAGFKQDLYNAYGHEYVIFDPNIIKSIEEIK